MTGAIVMESFTSNNIAELCRRHGVSVASFYKWRDKFIESGKKGFYESGRSGYNEYRKENEKLKKLIGDKALVLDELKKLLREEIMEAVNNLRNKLSVSRLSKIAKIQRSYIYYNRKITVKHKKSRIPENTINRVLEISGKRCTKRL